MIKKKFTLARFFFFLIMAAGIHGCDINGGKEKSSLASNNRDELRVIAEVNGEPIVEKEFLMHYGHFKDEIASSIKIGSEEEIQIKKNALDFLIEKKLIQQEAEKLGIIVTDFEIEESVKITLSSYSDEALQAILRKEKITIADWRDEVAYNLLIEKISSHILDKNIKVSDIEVKKYYEKNIKEFAKPLRLRVRHILVATLDEAKDIRKNLMNGADFQKIAREKSIAPEAAKGGDLGFLSKGDMPESFDEVLFDMAVGEVSRIVKTDYGFHIFKLVSKQNPEKINLKEAFKIIHKRLIDEKSNSAFKSWKDQLIKQSVIKYY